MFEPFAEDPGEPEVTSLGKIAAPWSKEITVEALRYPSGLQLARLRIREGRRFTVLDVDRPTAQRLADMLEQALEGGEA